MRIVNVWRIILAVLILTSFSGFAQEKADVDSRVWSMHYWKQMIAQGKVPAAPQVPVPAAKFTGSGIDVPGVEVDDSPDVLIGDGINTTQSEISGFIDPNDNNILFNSNNSSNGNVSQFYGTSAFTSFDGGQTWTGRPDPVGINNSGDPAAVVDLNGRYYIGHITGPFGQGSAYSTDQGASWTQVVISPSGTLDKNHLWVDNAPGSPHQGNLYSAWTAFDAGGDIEVSRSTDMGLTWDAPINVSAAITSGSHSQGVSIQTGPNGEVYAVWAIYDSWPADENAMGFNHSTDGGATWETPVRIITTIRGIRITETSKNQRVSSFPVMAADISPGSGSGNLYIVWPNLGVPGTNTGPDIDVYMIASTDGGSSWSTPSRVNQDANGIGSHHYYPWISCDPETGVLSAIWYDDRNVGGAATEVYMGVSSNQGGNWDDFKISDISFTPSPIPGLAGGYMGDYISVTSRGGKVYPIWMDNRSGPVLAYVSPIELADDTDPNPPSNTAAYSDFNTPNSVQLTWDDPTNYVGGDTLLPGNLTIEIDRDGANIASVPGGSGSFTDTGLSDGQLYEYIFTTKDVNDSLSLSASASWIAGGSPTPSAATNLAATATQTDAILTWEDPTTQIDGTPLDDLAGINIYRDGLVVAVAAPGTQTFTDVPPTGGIYAYSISAIDNEIPQNESGITGPVEAFVGAPVANANPDSFSFILSPGQVDSAALTISNTGNSDLNWALRDEDIFGKRPFSIKTITRHYPSNFYGMDQGKGQIDTRQGRQVVEGAGGPDNFGYRWIDSNEPGGPTFSWVDITGSGVPVSLGDDDFTEVTLPFTFSFYDVAHSSVQISSNGYLTFGTDPTDFSNDPIPDANNPNDIICPFWDDLNPNEGGSIHYLVEPNQLTVQYTDIQRFGGSPPNTFQVTIKESGQMIYQYLSMTSPLTSATVGIENFDATDGLEIVFNAAYVEDNLAVLIAADSPWLSANPGNGVVPANGSVEVQVVANTSGLADGSYLAKFVLESNDPVASEIDIPVSMEVTSDPQTARLQVIHNAADPAAAVVDIYLDGALLLDDFGFRTATPFIDAPALVPFNIGVAPGSSSSVDDTLKNFVVQLSANGTYAAVASGLLDAAAFAPNPDGRSTAFTLLVQPDAQETGAIPQLFDFYGVHGSTDAPTVDIIANGAISVLDNFAYSDVSAYRSVPPAPYTLELTDSSGTNVLKRFSADLSALGGAAAAVVASGFLDSTANQNGPAFALLVVFADGSVLELPEEPLVGIGDDDGGLPLDFALYNNYPNPFNPTTTLKYALKENADVRLEIYNVLGQLVRTLVNGKQSAGFREVRWDGRSDLGVQVTSGVYLYRLQANNFVESRKMILLK